MSYEALSWDSAFFEIPIGRITGRPDSDTLAESVARADADGMRCLYHLVAAGDLDALHAALGHGFAPYDIRVEFELTLGTPGRRDPSVAIRDAAIADEEQVAALATRTISSTRFTRDDHFPQDRVRQLYAEWVHRGLTSGPARRVLLAEPGAGFVVCAVAAGESTGSIELIGVDSRFARRGIGRALLHEAHALMHAAGCHRARVVTQGDNMAAQALYQSVGYRTRALAWWLHRWTSD